MKKFIKTFVIFLAVLLLWARAGIKKADRNYFLPSSTLDMARPLDVTIDVEFIRGLFSAYGK